jgi:23S rRNA pseudouridine2605 synthase
MNTENPLLETIEPTQVALSEPHLAEASDTMSSTQNELPVVPKVDASIPFGDIISGRFDDEQARDETESEGVQPAGKRVLAPEVESPKLHKILAQAGLGSRLEMEQMIVEGRITVNKEAAHVGMRIQYGDQIAVNGKPIKVRIDAPPARILAYHKPAGEVVTHDDPQNRPTVFRRLPKLYQGKWQSVGRLDLNTEGLLLFTSSGELANRLTHPRFGLEREYAVRVLGALSNEEKQQLLDGVMLDDGLAQFGSIEDGGGEGANCWYRVTISEGRNREVRRMIESLGHAVSRLIRIRYGTMLLPKGLKRGFWMELDEADVRALQNASGGAPKRADGEAGAEVRGRGGRTGAPRQGGDQRGGQRGGLRGAGNGSGAASAGRGRGSPDRGGYKGNTPRPDNRNNVRPTAPGQGGGRGSYNNSSEHSNDNNDGINNDRLPSGINPERTSMDFGRRSFGSGGGAGNSSRGGGGGRGRTGSAQGGQPDPMQTSFGYIGADSLQRQRAAPTPGGRGGRGSDRGNSGRGGNAGSGNNAGGGGFGGGNSGGRGRSR